MTKESAGSSELSSDRFSNSVSSSEQAPHSRTKTTSYTRTFQQVVFGNLLTSKRLFIDTSWEVLVTKGSPLGDTLSLSCEASVCASGFNN